MQLHRIRLKNFRLHADTDVHLGAGITAVVGPNGVGKSTLLEAIAWAFYGTPAARGPRDSIRRSDAPARETVRVDVEFALGGTDYRVVRKLNNAELFEGNSSAPIANSSRTVTERVTALLAMSRDEFFNTYFTGQKELAVMASMGPTERGKFLSRLMGYDRLRDAQVGLKARRNELKTTILEVERTVEDGKALRETRVALSAKVDAVRTEAAAAMQRHTAAILEMDEIKPVWQQIQEQREQSRSLEAELSLARQKLDEAVRESERLNAELAVALESRDEANALQPVLDNYDALQKEFAVLDQAAQSAERTIALNAEATAVDRQLQDIARRLTDLANVTDLAQQAEKAKDAAVTELHQLASKESDTRTKWVADRQDVETRHKTLRENYKIVKDDRTRIEQLGTEGKCPTCARPLGEEFDKVLETLTLQLEEIESQGVYLKRRVTQLAGEPGELKELQQEQQRVQAQREQALNALVEARARLNERAEAEREHEQLCERRAAIDEEIAALPDVFDAARHKELREVLRNMQTDVVRAGALRERAEQAVTLTPRAAEAEQILATRHSEVENLRTRMAELGFDEGAFTTARERFHKADLELRDAELTMRDVSGKLKLVEQELAGLDVRIEEHAERVKRLGGLRSEFNLHDELDTALDELRRELNARLRPDLSDAASLLLAELTDGRYHELELTDKFEVLVLEDGLPRNVISGGEEDIANLVLRVAISQMVAERAGLPLSLLVLDEIFGGLDEDRRRNVIDMLRGLAARFPQVILITHIEQVRQGVDRVLRVELDPKGGSARVVEDEIEIPGAEHAAA